MNVIVLLILAAVSVKVLTNIRDRSMYENGYAEEDSAKVLIKTELESWYNKYIETTDADIYILIQHFNLYMIQQHLV